MIFALTFIFSSCCEKAHDTKEFSQKIQIFIMNLKSQPMKSNPEMSFMCNRLLILDLFKS